MNNVPVFRARYRVLLIKNRAAQEPENQVVAICLEQNLVGRGSKPAEALQELADTLIESHRYWLEEAVRAPESDPDPELISLYEQRSIGQTQEGDLILNRLAVNVCIDTVVGPSTSSRRSGRQVTFEEPVLA